MLRRPGRSAFRSVPAVGLVVVASLFGATITSAGPASAARPAASTGKACTIVGTEGNDRLRGTRANDVICGLGGNDTIVGGTGNDVIDGGAGRDRIDGGAGNDQLIGGTGDDTLTGGAGNDRIDGGAGNDQLIGGAGDDILAGGAGNDSIRGQDGDDRIDGGTGTDTVDGGAGRDLCTGGAGDRRSSCPLPSAPAPTSPVPDSPDVPLAVTTSITGHKTACTKVGTHGNDRIYGTPGYDVICGLGGDDVIEGGGGDDVIDGGEGNDKLDAGAGDDIVGGGNGDDQLSGGDGDDKLDGGPGSDRVDGGTGLDTCVIVAEDISPADACSDTTRAQADLGGATWLGSSTVDNDQARTVTLQMRATDDRSGVARVSAILAGPQGYISLEGSRPSSGTANDGVWRVSGTLPAGATTGQWRLTNLWVSDRALHDTAYRIAADGTYTVDFSEQAGVSALGPLTVTGAATDDAPPTIDLPSAQWTNASVVDNSTEQTVGLRVRVTDAGTGVAWVSAVLSPDRRAVLHVTGRLVSGTPADGVWELTTVLPANATVADWHLLSIASADRGGQGVGYNADFETNTVLDSGDGKGTVPNPLSPFAVKGVVSDVAGPAADFESITFTSPSTVTNNVDQPVVVRVRITDDGVGVSPGGATNLFVTLGGPGGVVLEMSWPRLVQGTATDGVWEFRGSLPKYAAAGVWRFTGIQTSDRIGRKSVYRPVGEVDGPWADWNPSAPQFTPKLPSLTVQETKLAAWHS
ncbi:calcium-binding protein [Actinoplanes sp. NPDC049548]|uniref:calcium-binding protein n=1 Tax=Actinoplanes sp. NPDC049548 TaxID=3155152 RepID=UPI003448A15C